MGNVQNLAHGGSGDLGGQAFNGNAGRPLAYLRKVIIHLHPKPRVSRAAKSLFKADRHFRRYAATLGNDVVKLLAGNTDSLGGFGNAQAEVFKARLDELAGMRRVFHIHGSASLQW